MEKGKKPNMEKVGRSKSTPKIRLMEHNSERKSILNSFEYDFTLKQWLEINHNNWDVEYGKWKVYRPNEEARQIIQGILHAVYKLHSKNSSHGFLYHPENFAIQDNEIMIGGDHKKSKNVFLMDKNKNISDDVLTNNNAQQGDRFAVSNLIFVQILKATNEKWHYPQDLENLRERLTKTEHVSSKEWILIFNHPSLWHWKSRFDYPERVWTHCENANYDVYEDMKDGFHNINVLGWGKNINDESSPFWKVYYYNDRKNNYGDGSFHLLHYLRNVRDHYRKHVSENSYDVIFFNTKFIELKMTEISELFLLELYSMMCKKNIEI